MAKKRKWVLEFAAFRDRTLQMVRDLANTFSSPDEDWQPVLFLQCDEQFYVMALSSIFQTRESKLVLPVVLEQVFKQYKPVLAGLVLSAWYSQVSASDPLAGLTAEMTAIYGVSADPLRKEMVLVDFAGKDGKSEVWSAEIKRSPDTPPTLEPWMKWTEGVGGRFGNALKKAFSSVK